MNDMSDRKDMIVSGGCGTTRPDVLVLPLVAVEYINVLLCRAARHSNITHLWPACKSVLLCVPIINSLGANKLYPLTSI